MYFASQRAFALGAIYEVTGPFRRERPPERFPPAVKLIVPEEIPMRRLARRGLPVEVRASRPVTLASALRTARPRRRAGKLSRARQLLLGRRRTALPQRGRVQFTVRLGRAGRRRLRRLRPSKVTLSVRATDSFGNRRRLTEEVRLRRGG